MGFDVTNVIFAENAWYFRNSLVRANFTDLSKGIRDAKQDIQNTKQDIDRSNESSVNNCFSGIRIDKKNVGNEMDISV